MAAAALFSLGACNEIREDATSGELVPLKFSASVGAYATKATDTSFQQGDAVGLFAGAPLNLTNEKLVWNGSSLVPSRDLYWPLGSEGTADFRAYYPYNEELKALEGEIPFKVSLEQNEYANYTASDLMFAATKASPKDESVKLAFDHKLSKLVIKVENNTGEAVREALVGVRYAAAVVNAASGEIVNAAGDEYAIIRAFVSGETISAIVPPQTAAVELLVTTLSGKAYAFETPAVELLSGKQSKGTVTIDAVPEADKVEFELTIAPWEEGGNLVFTDAEPGERSGYDVYIINRRERIPMTETRPGEFTFNFPNYMGEAFYVLNVNSNYIYGCTLRNPQTLALDSWPVVNGGNFQLQDYKGDLYVRFYPDEGLLKYEPVYPNWEKLGEGEIVRGMFSNFYNFIPEITRATVYEDAAHPGMYRVSNPYEDEGVQNYYIQFYNDIVIDARNPEKVYMLPVSDVWEAMMLNWQRYFTLFSDVVENGEDGEPYKDRNYGYLKDGVIHLGYLTARYNDGSEDVFNTDDAFQLVLPGCKRDPVLGFGYSFDGTREDSGVIYADFTLKPYPDMQNVRYMFFSGRPSAQEIRGDILPALRAGGGDPVPGIEMGQEYYFSIPVTQSGRYTGFFYADAPDVDTDFWYYYNYFVAEVPGSDFPFESISITEAAPLSLFPDKAAAVHVQFPYATSMRVRAISLQAAEEAGLTEDDYYSYAMAGNFAPGFMSFVGDNSGADLSVTGLLPDTDYLILAAGYDFKETSSWTSATVHTAAEPSWSDFGQGSWTDDSWLTGGYTAPVLIQKASEGERYRAVKPYADYWSSQWPVNCKNEPEEYEGTYAGYSEDFEFTFVKDGGQQFIYYLPFRPGYILPNLAIEGTDNGMIEFNHHNLAEKHPQNYDYIVKNQAISEGIYNIAPYGSIVNTSYYYNWLNEWKSWIIAMPGYSYTPAQVPALRKNKADAAQTAPVSGEHKVLPFKRLPVKLGKPVVTPVNN